jgi:hypothetical protein
MFPAHTADVERGAHLITASAREPPPEPPAAPEPPAVAVVDDPEPRQIQDLESQLSEIATERQKADRELSELRSRSVAPYSPAPPVAPPAAEPPVGPKPKPTRADFFDAEDPDEAFLDALSDYKDNERARVQRLADEAKSRQEQENKAQEEARKRQEAESARKAEESKVADEYKASLDAARAKHSDWDAVLATPGELCSPAMAYVAQIAANAEIFYWLGKHPEEATRICAATKLPQNASEAERERAKWVARREFDKIEAGLRAMPRSAAPQVKPVKKHTPVTPVANRGGPAQKTLSEMTAEEVRNLSPTEYRKLRGA